MMLFQKGSNETINEKKISINSYNSHHRSFYLVSHIIVVIYFNFSLQPRIHLSFVNQAHTDFQVSTKYVFRQIYTLLQFECKMHQKNHEFERKSVN